MYVRTHHSQLKHGCVEVHLFLFLSLFLFLFSLPLLLLFLLRFLLVAVFLLRRYCFFFVCMLRYRWLACLFLCVPV